MAVNLWLDFSISTSDNIPTGGCGITEGPRALRDTPTHRDKHGLIIWWYARCLGAFLADILISVTEKDVRLFYLALHSNWQHLNLYSCVYFRIKTYELLSESLDFVRNKQKTSSTGNLIFDKTLGRGPKKMLSSTEIKIIKKVFSDRLFRAQEQKVELWKNMIHNNENMSRKKARGFFFYIKKKKNTEGM